jgi:hypothetical protein
MYGWTKSHCTVGERMADSDYAKFGNSEQQPPREGTHTNTVARTAGRKGGQPSRPHSGGCVRVRPLNVTR